MLRYFDVKTLTGRHTDYRTSLDDLMSDEFERAPLDGPISPDLLAISVRHAVDPHVWSDRTWLECKNGILIVRAPLPTIKRVSRYLSVLRAAADSSDARRDKGE